MRTTVDIPDETYRLLKSKAVSQGVSIKALVLRGVESVLIQEEPRKVRRLTLPIVPGGVPGSLKLDNEKIYDLIGFP